MSHSPLCLWKRDVLKHKLRREITLEEVHLLCDELGFIDPNETAAWIIRASPDEIEDVLRRVKRRKNRRRGEAYSYEYEAVYATA